MQFDKQRVYINFSLLVLLAGLLLACRDFIITDEVVIDFLSKQLSYERIESLLEFRNSWKWVNYAIIPFFYLIKISILSLWILSGIIIFGYKNTFREIFQVVLVAEFTWLIPPFITIVWFGFIDTTYTLPDVQYFQPLSLLNFFNATEIESWLVFPLQSLNLFEIMYMLVMAFSIKRVLRKDYKEALGFTVPVYGSALITWIVFITFLNINLTS